MQGLDTAEQKIVDALKAIDSFEEDEVEQLQCAIESIEEIIPNIKDEITKKKLSLLPKSIIY